MNKRSVRSKSKFNIKTTFLVLGVSFCLALLFNNNVKASEEESIETEDTILPNVYIGNVDVGGMTADEAKSACSNYFDGLGSKTITFSCGDATQQMLLSDVGLSADIEGTVEDALNYGHKGNVLKRYKDTKNLEAGNIKNLDLKINIQSDSYDNINNVLVNFNQEASPASIELVDGEFEIQPETIGVAVDTQATLDALQADLESATDFDNILVDVVRSEVKPEVTSEELDGITDKLGEFSTNYSGDSGRMKNVENGCSFINGTVLMPGEVFDTDATIRPYTEENGYYYAGEYNNGKVVQGLGGGICQVSTTLYNAVLYSELEIVERYNHSLTVGYVQLSQDAAIAGTTKNFKFRNNTDTPIYIAGACEDGQITFAIFGKETRPENRTIEFESVLVSTIPPGEPIEEVDPSLPPGTREVTQNAHTGYVAELWKHIYIDGELTESEKVNTSNYISTPEYVTIGPEEAAEETPEEETTEAVPADAPADPSTEEPAEPVPEE